MRRSWLLLVLLAGSLGAQNPAATIKANVRQVLVPVVVTDKSGHYVTDLSASDFQVLEDGSPQKIVAFSKANVSVAGVAASPAAAAPASIAAPPPKAATSGLPKRTYLVCVDTLHSDFGNFNQVRGALKKFFGEEQADDSQYVLITLGRQAHLVIDSTRDPGAVLAAIGSKAFLTDIGQSEASNIALQRKEFRDLMRLHYCNACACINTMQNTNTDGPSCPAVKAQVQEFLLSFGERTADLNQIFLDNLEQIVHAIARMPTYRTVVFLSDGFNRFPGRELYGILNGYGPKDHSFRFNPRDLQPELDKVLKVAERYDVRFYTIDSRGLMASGSVASTGIDPSLPGYTPYSVEVENDFVAHENTDALAELAHDTGGLFFENSNDLLKGIRRAFADGRDLYVIAYNPSNAALDGKFRKIEVQVKDKKLHVTAKAGYWATQ